MQEDLMEINLVNLIITLDGKDVEIKITDGQIKEFIKPKKWKPEYGGIYFYVDRCFIAHKTIWINDLWDKVRYKYGNVFKTQEEVILEAGKRLAELESE